MPENPYQPPKEVNKRRGTKSPLVVVGTTSLIGLLVGIGIGCAGILLLPTHSADKRTAYDWTFLALVSVLAGFVVGIIVGINRLVTTRNPRC
jgi:uncharacterized membrane-anchored protein YhcB (DUF1043 family)